MNQARILLILVFAMTLGDRPATAQRRDQAIAAVQGDANRPVYHFRPTAGSMNDINGPIFHKGFYHIFYQFNPPGTRGKHWGHARSKDLVRWEHLPIALQPSEKEGEIDCYSGSSVINGRGEPMLFYTSISRGYRDRPRPKDWHLKTWAATGDADLLTWQKHPANTLISRESHGPAGDGYDPFVFQNAGRTFLVLTTGSRLQLFEAANPELTRWTYRGILFERPSGHTGTWECPNFFRLGDQWVLLVSPSPQPIEYFIGSFDQTSFRFRPRTEGILDHGRDAAGRFCAYASNVLFDRQGRCVLFAWVHVQGHPAGSGCMTLPRTLTLGPTGKLCQQPVKELESLRGRHHAVPVFTVNDTRRMLEGATSDTVEMNASFELGDAKTIGLGLRRSADGKRTAAITYDRESLQVLGTKVPHLLPQQQKEFRLHFFLDNRILEVYTDDGRVCITRVLPADAEARGIEVFATGGQARVKELDVWEMTPIW